MKYEVLDQSWCSGVVVFQVQGGHDDEPVEWLCVKFRFLLLKLQIHSIARYVSIHTGLSIVSIDAICFCFVDIAYILFS